MLVFLFVSQLCLSGAMQSGIFGGKEAKPHSRPYMASLQVRGDHVCGGVLIREDYVLTAAHCLNYSDPVQEVLLGAHNIDRKEKGQKRMGIFKPFPHPNYPREKLQDDDPRTREHDIMLLKLKAKVKLSKFVKVLELPKGSEKIPEDQQCEVAGWGKRVLGRPSESVLYEAKVTLDSANACKQAWRKYFNQFQMTCSKSDGKAGVCQGDSGGPLICGKGKTKVLYGLTAYTDHPCDSERYPEVYTRVPFFLPWIEKVLEMNDAL